MGTLVHLVTMVLKMHHFSLVGMDKWSRKGKAEMELI